MFHHSACSAPAPSVNIRFLEPDRKPFPCCPPSSPNDTAQWDQAAHAPRWHFYAPSFWPTIPQIGLSAGSGPRWGACPQLVGVRSRPGLFFLVLALSMILSSSPGGQPGRAVNCAASTPLFFAQLPQERLGLGWLAGYSPAAAPTRSGRFAAPKMLNGSTSNFHNPPRCDAKSADKLRRKKNGFPVGKGALF